MGLAYRVIPVMLCRGRQLVKGKQFNSWRSVGSVTQAARVHARRGVDELMILDIDATKHNRGPDLGLIEDLTDNFFTPIVVGGGVRTLDHTRALLNVGADSVVVCSGGPKAVRAIADVVGSQAVVAAVDYKFDNYCYTHNGTRQIPMEPKLWASEMVRAGAGEILLTCIDREGTFTGYDLVTIKRLRDHGIRVPIVAHGGCGYYSHMLDAIQAGANAVAAGSLFQFEDATPYEAAQFLHSNGVEVRIPERGQIR